MNFIKGINLESIQSPEAIFIDKTAIFLIYEKHISLTKLLNPS